jgi:hypothetical protein
MDPLSDPEPAPLLVNLLTLAVIERLGAAGAPEAVVLMCPAILAELLHPVGPIQ